MGQLNLSLNAIERGVLLLSKAAAAGTLSDVLATEGMSSGPDGDGVTVHFRKTAGASGSWEEGMYLAWRSDGRHAWILFVTSDFPITVFWPRDATALRRWRKDNPPSPDRRLVRSLVLPEDELPADELHRLLFLQAALHAVQDGVVRLADHPDDVRLFERFREMAEPLDIGVALDPNERLEVIHKVFSRFYQYGPRRGLLGAYRAWAFPRYVRTAMRPEAIELIRGREAQHVATAPGALEDGVPSGLRQAGEKLGVSKDTVGRHLARLGFRELTEESWPRVCEAVSVRQRWARVRVRLVDEEGLTYEAARKRVHRWLRRGLTVEEAEGRWFAPADEWENLEKWMVEEGFTPDEAARCLADLRRAGFDTPEEAEPRIAHLLGIYS